MQVSSFMTDLMEFKDEIFKKVRLLESKLTTEFKAKYSEIFANFEKLDNKLNFITESNESLLESVAEQRVNLGKVSELESFKNKTENNIIMHDIRIKSMSSDIDNLKNKYDKTIYDNLQVPGYVGPGCQFKSIAEYITNNILEFSKLKNDSDKMKIENVEIRNRLDNILKSTLNLIDNSIMRCQKYSDNKHQDMQKILDNKLVEFSEKNNDLIKTETQNEKQIENLKLDVEKLLLMKNELITLTDQKIEEINNKIEAMTQEINFMKLKKKENESKKENQKEKEGDYNNTNNSNNNMSNSIINDNNNSNNIKNKEESNIKIKTNINNLKKSNYKLQKNPMFINSNNDYNIKNNINGSNDVNINNSNNIKNKLNINNSNSNFMEQPKYNKINYNRELKNLNQKKEEKLELYEEEHSSKNDEKNISRDNKTNIKNKEFHFSKEENKEEMKAEIKKEAEKEAKKVKIKEIKEKSKVKEETHKVQYIEKYSQNPKINEPINKGKMIKNNSSPILEKPIKFEGIFSNNLNNNVNININYKDRELKDSMQIISNKKKINTKKIKIESLEKKKYLHSNSSINSNEFKNKKEGHNHNNYEYNEPLINNNIHLLEEIKVSKSPIARNFSKINIVNKKHNIEDCNFCLTPKSFNTIDRNDRINRKYMKEYNEEQLEIMNKIKTFYNNKKEKNEQKSQENVVDCNVINLNLEKGLQNKKKNSDKNNLHLSKDNNKFPKENKARNNLSEIGMKITPAFGRTTYSFYNKKDYNGNAFNNVMQNNRKINSLKDRLNIAFVSTIKQRLNLHDKAINVK